METLGGRTEVQQNGENSVRIKGQWPKDLIFPSPTYNTLATELTLGLNKSCPSIHLPFGLLFSDCGSLLSFCYGYLHPSEQ